MRASAPDTAFMTLGQEGPGGDTASAERELLGAIKQRPDDIDGLLKGFAEAEEDGVYRYYHQSLKVYALQRAVKVAQRLFEDLAPEHTRLNAWCVSICQAACEHQFDSGRSNENWQAETRPILEGFWHCSYFLRMMARYGRELEEPPSVLPYGWAAVLYLYGIR